MSRTYRRKKHKADIFHAYDKQEFQHLKENIPKKPEETLKRPNWTHTTSYNTALTVARLLGPNSKIAKLLEEHDKEVRVYLEKFYSDEQIAWRRWCRFNNHIRGCKTFEEYDRFMENLYHSDTWPTDFRYDDCHTNHNRKLRRSHKKAIRDIQQTEDCEYLDVDIYTGRKWIFFASLKQIHQYVE